MLYARKQVCLGTIMLFGSIFGLIVRRVAAEQYTCFLFFVFTERSRFAGAGLAALDPPVTYASTLLSALACKTRPAVRLRS